MADEVLFERGTVRVSTTRATFGNADYPIASISSVRVKAGGSRFPVALGLLILAVLGIGLGSRGAAMCGLGGGLLLVVALLYGASKEPSRLYLATTGRELEALRGAPSEIDAIAAALRSAIDARG